MKHHVILGSCLALLSALFYSSQTALIKVSVGVLPPLPVVIFFQSLFSLILLLPFLFKKNGVQIKTIFATQKLYLHVIRTFFSLGISYLLFFAVTKISLVNGMLLLNTAPLIVPFIGFIFLSQKMNHRLWLPVFLGFVGVALVLRPDSHFFNIASLLALFSGICLASTMLSVRRLSLTDSSETIAFYFFFLSTVFSGLISIHFWQPLTFKMLEIMFLVGLFYFCSQFLATYALKYANAQLVGSLFYSNVVYAAIIALIVWHTVPTPLTILGTFLIISGGILCIHVEHKSRLLELKHVKA